MFLSTLREEFNRLETYSFYQHWHLFFHASAGSQKVNFCINWLYKWNNHQSIFFHIRHIHSIFWIKSKNTWIAWVHTDSKTLFLIFFSMIKAVPKAPLSQGFLPDVTTRHEGLIRARPGQLGQPGSRSTTEAGRVVIKESKSCQARTIQENPGQKVIAIRVITRK